MARAIVCSSLVISALLLCGCGGGGASVPNPPQGKVAFYATGTNGTVSGPGIFVMNPDGSNLIKVYSGQAAAPVLSPDRQWVVFSTSNGGRLVRTDGSGALITLPSTGLRYYAFSPDSTKLVYSTFDTQREIKVYTIATSSSVTVDSGLNINPWVAFTPNGNSVVYGAEDPTIGQGRAGDDYALCIKPANGTGTRQVLVNFPGLTEQNVAFSPDGSKIGCMGPNGSANVLWVADANGDNPREVSTQNIQPFYAVVWGNNTTLYGGAISGPNNGRTIKFDISGVNTVETPLASGPTFQIPLAVSPDEQYVLVNCSDGTKARCGAIPVDGSAATYVSDPGYEATYPDWK